MILFAIYSAKKDCIFSTCVIEALDLAFFGVGIVQVNREIRQ